MVPYALSIQKGKEADSSNFAHKFLHVFQEFYKFYNFTKFY